MLLGAIQGAVAGVVIGGVLGGFDRYLEDGEWLKKLGRQTRLDRFWLFLNIQGLQGGDRDVTDDAASKSDFRKNAHSTAIQLPHLPSQDVGGLR